MRAARLDKGGTGIFSWSGPTPLCGANNGDCGRAIRGMVVRGKVDRRAAVVLDREKKRVCACNG
jgi:hypothetical protein